MKSILFLASRLFLTFAMLTFMLVGSAFADKMKIKGKQIWADKL